MVNKNTTKNGKKSLSTWVIIDTKNLVCSNKKKSDISPLRDPQMIETKCSK